MQLNLPPRLRKAAEESGLLSVDPKSGLIFLPYCPWHIQMAQCGPLREAGKVRSPPLRWSQSVHLLGFWARSQFSLLKQNNSPVFIRADKVKLEPQVAASVTHCCLQPVFRWQFGLRITCVLGFNCDVGLMGLIKLQHQQCNSSNLNCTRLIRSLFSSNHLSF